MHNSEQSNHIMQRRKEGSFLDFPHILDCINISKTERTNKIK